MRSLLPIKCKLICIFHYIKSIVWTVFFKHKLVRNWFTAYITKSRHNEHNGTLFAPAEQYVYSHIVNRHLRWSARMWGYRFL